MMDEIHDLRAEVGALRSQVCDNGTKTEMVGRNGGAHNKEENEEAGVAHASDTHPLLSSGAIRI